MQITKEEMEQVLNEFFETQALPLRITDMCEAARTGARGLAQLIMKKCAPPDDKDTPKK